MVSSTRLANFKTLLVMIRPKDSLTTPMPIEADSTASPAEMRTRDGSEGKSSIHLARDCLLMMIKLEIQATNVMNTAAENQYLSSVITRDPPATMPAIAKAWFALRYGIFSNPTLTEDKLSTTHQPVLILEDNIELTVYYKQDVTHQSPDECDRNQGDHDKGKKEGRGIG